MDRAAAERRLREVVGDRLKIGEPLSGYTTLRVGGPADFLTIAQTTDEVAALVRAAIDLDLPWRIIGRGSNLLVADRGVRGLVIRNTARTIEVLPEEEAGRTVVRADAGLSCANLAGRTAKLGLTGLEFAVAIPGTVGGAVVQNAGAHGSEMVDVLVSVETLDRAGEIRHLAVGDLELAYRTSRFKCPPRDQAVLRADMRLDRASSDGVARKIEEIRAWRAASQPAEPSAGSIFTNPPDDYAGRLVEAAGLKGATEGGAQISPKHANFVVNLGGARAEDVQRLIQRAQAEVERRFGVRLEPEVERLGEW